MDKAGNGNGEGCQGNAEVVLVKVRGKERVTTTHIRAKVRRGGTEQMERAF